MFKRILLGTIVNVHITYTLWKKKCLNSSDGHTNVGALMHTYDVIGLFKVKSSRDPKDIEILDSVGKSCFEYMIHVLSSANSIRCN